MSERKRYSPQNVRRQSKERQAVRKKEWRWFEVGHESHVGWNCVNADIRAVVLPLVHSKVYHQGCIIACPLTTRALIQNWTKGFEPHIKHSDQNNLSGPAYFLIHSGVFLIGFYSQHGRLYVMCVIKRDDWFTFQVCIGKYCFCICWFARSMFSDLI